MPAPSIGTELSINQSTTGTQLFPTVAAMADGRFVIAWYDNEGADYVYRGFHADGAARGDDQRITTAASNTIENRI